MMMIKFCKECGSTCQHNSLGKKKAEEGKVASSSEAGWRCTKCGFPLGTGWKAERNRDLHRQQVVRLKVGRGG